jgi:chromosome segregation ATPase
MCVPSTPLATDSPWTSEKIRDLRSRLACGELKLNDVTKRVTVLENIVKPAPQFDTPSIKEPWIVRVIHERDKFIEALQNECRNLKLLLEERDKFTAIDLKPRDAFKKERDKLQSKCIELRQQNDRYVAFIDNQDDVIKGLKQELERERETLTQPELYNEISRLKTALRSKETALERAASEINELKRNLENAQETLIIRKSKIDSLCETIKDRDDLVSSLRAECARLSNLMKWNKHDAACKEISRLTAECNKLKAELEMSIAVSSTRRSLIEKIHSETTLG